ncbi:MAG TPA: TetR-like C-terminal domain-containing protein [Bacillota bacterium]|uniref:TetR/AcrR family transcriptional regulator n=1 Tax=Sinanaerobacter chloroacetimidivorans TaxID=2818044 RepID=A0A8J7VYU7_9FIRM|nr:TetR/AcrR family transcriptional regulator [Sinanaerobacter chloroacetimidivorans]MBR0597647.1 TetR/AcrR family transcriptional regulator [Sinanaerobacter chloroacetimidivorans]HML36176.1 TetR-like C-terminal domain-containing protein [Bacillota bacterium]
MNHESRKVAKTKGIIKDAFLELCKENKLEKISIKDITTNAHINRSTFYLYYKDIYDLLESIENEFLADFTNKIKDVYTIILKDGDIYPIIPSLEFYQKYSKYLMVLLGSNGDPVFAHKLKAIIKNNLSELLKSEELQTVPYLDYIIEYLASAQIGVLTYWLQSEMMLPMEVIGDLLKKMSLYGPIGYMKLLK